MSVDIPYFCKMKSNAGIRILKATTKENIVQSVIFSGFVLLFWFLYSHNGISDFKSLINVILYAASYIIILLFNIHFLFVKLFQEQKYFTYFLTTIATFLAGYLAQQLIYAESINAAFLDIAANFEKYLLDWCINILTFVMFGSFGLSFKLIYLWLKTQNQLSELKGLNLEIELQNLKNQISPHFLFNTLNNIYILVKTNAEAASGSIMNLSDLIRYQMQSIARETVPIQEEIEYMQNLLDLERIRRDDLQINYKLDVKNPDFRIQPLLLSPLIENAIKHGSQKLNQCRIDININVDDFIDFEIQNSVPGTASVDYSFGMGLNNLKRRLEICYPDKYSLNLEKSNGNFIARLILR